MIEIRGTQVVSNLPKLAIQSSKTAVSYDRNLPSRADDDIHLRLNAIGIDDSLGSDLLDSLGKSRHIGTIKSLQKAVSRGRPPAADVEGGGDQLLHDVSSVSQLLLHLAQGKLNTHS